MNGSLALRALRFYAVGGSGIVVNQAVLVCLLAVSDLHYLFVTAIATQAAIAWNFALTERWVFARHVGAPQAPDIRADGSGSAQLRWRWLQFWLTSTATLVIHGPMMVVLTAIGWTVAMANLSAIAAVAVLRFAIADLIIWSDRKALAPHHQAALSTGGNE